jgi:hypothetical protein
LNFDHNISINAGTIKVEPALVGNGDKCKKISAAMRKKLRSVVAEL